jgi:hypothetical protein
MTTTRDRLRREIEDTRLAFHRLLDTIPDEAFFLPSGNPAWTVGQVLYHMSFAPRFMVLDVQMIGGQRWIYRLVPRLFPKRLFDWLNARMTRVAAGTPTRAFVSTEYEQAHASIRKVLESLSEKDLAKHAPYPDWDPLLSGEVAMEYLFGYIKRHFDSHAVQIRQVLRIPGGEDS